MTARARLPNCRASVTFTFWCNSLLYTATVSYFANGDLAEIFLQNAKAGSHSDAAAKDSAVVCSIALQYGVPVVAWLVFDRNCTPELRWLIGRGTDP